MKALIVGTGGVGESMASIAKRGVIPRGEIFERIVLADYDLAKAQAASTRLGEERFPAEQVDGLDPDAVAALADEARRRHHLQPAARLRRCSHDEGGAQGEAPLPRHRHVRRPRGRRRRQQRPISGSVQFDYHEHFEQHRQARPAGPGHRARHGRLLRPLRRRPLLRRGRGDGRARRRRPRDPRLQGHGLRVLDLDDDRRMHGAGDRLGGRQRLLQVEPFSELEEFLFPGGIGVQELGHVEHDEVSTSRATRTCSRA